MNNKLLSDFCSEKPEFSKFFEILKIDISLSETHMSNVGNYFQAVVKSLSNIDNIVKKHLSHIDLICEKWNSMPRRGSTTPIRFLLNTNFDSRGNLVFNWVPYFQNQSDANICLNLLTHHLGREGNTIKVDKVKLLSELILAKKYDSNLSDEEHDAVIRARNVLWSISLLQDILCFVFSTKAECQAGTRINFSYDGSVTLKDDFQTKYEKYLNWLNNFSSRFQFSLESMLYFIDEKYSPQQVRDFTKGNFLREMTYAEASNAMKTLSEIAEYNASVWRRTQPIMLPEKKTPEKVIPENKLLVQKNGKSPRLSPIAIRGVEASNIVDLDKLKTAIEQRILENGIDWHFSAGDFIDMVELGARGEIVAILNRIKTKGDIVAIYKGIYTSNIKYADPVSGLEAILRDRGELFISSYERAFCDLGFQGNIFNSPCTFFTNGNLRNFYCLKTKIKLSQEPYPGFCDTALDCENPNAFIACSSFIINGNLNKYSDIVEKSGWSEELTKAQRFLGRFY